ncbi:hypothetical protein CAOG_003358 [Capsaspora owczarzaki ATCC 30864]|uniref:Uncharacterized protein n=1 Tax=Capsaspora owczarzaki (strain ATCC 30864) TaxID=595528 RepID=A0A0D2WP59_CAPO3|nr:hypothetical protein CAOG_003358 [Capsaspora owczarzaki ATCC 30864]
MLSWNSLRSAEFVFIMQHSQQHPLHQQNFQALASAFMEQLQQQHHPLAHPLAVGYAPPAHSIIPSAPLHPPVPVLVHSAIANSDIMRELSVLLPSYVIRTSTALAPNVVVFPLSGAAFLLMSNPSMPLNAASVVEFADKFKSPYILVSVAHHDKSCLGRIEDVQAILGMRGASVVPVRTPAAIAKFMHTTATMLKQPACGVVAQRFQEYRALQFAQVAQIAWDVLKTIGLSHHDIGFVCS